MRLIADQVVRLKNQVYNLSEEIRTLRRTASKGADIFVGTAEANAAFSYPTSGCQFPVTLKEYHWSEAVDTCPTMTGIDLGRHVVARTIDESFVESGTNVVVVRARGGHGGRWYIVNQLTPDATAGGLVYAVANEALHPGQAAGTGNFSRYTCINGSWVDSGVDINVGDPANANMFFSGEAGYMASCGGSTYQPIGSQGLTRIAACPVSISCDQSGSTLLLNAGTTSGAVSVTGYNTWPGYRRNILAGYNDVHLAIYDQTWSRWILQPQSIAMMAQANLLRDLDPGGQGTDATPAISSASFALLDFATASCTLTETVGSIRNPYKLAGEQNDAVLLLRDILNGGDAWILLDVQRAKVETADDARLAEDSGSTWLQLRKKDTWVHKAPTDPNNWINEIETCP